MYQLDMDGDHCCRICLTDLKFGGGIDIFGDQGRREMLPYKIRRYLYITVNVDDVLPKAICNTCFRRVNAICRYSLQAAQNQKELSNHFKNRQGVRGLLHAYLTNDIKTEREDDDYTYENEEGVDPMMLVQCSLGDDTEPQPEENYDLIEKPMNYSTTPKLFYAQYPAEVQIWTSSGHTKRILLNKNHAEVEIYDMTATNEISAHPKHEHTCPVCGKVATSNENLKVHVETHRPKGKYECNKCGRIFKTLCNLHRHQECHAEEEGNKYRCQTCGRLYTSNSTLRAHSITHSDVRPHKCPHCVKTFKRNQDLKFHINQHTGARPYQCPYCPKAFASSGNCFSHRKRMHPIEVERDRERAAKIMR